VTNADPKAELQAAERALANFDHSTMTDSDGNPSMEAEHKLAALQQRVATAKAAVEAAGT
jgi:hypothetical protein